MANKQDLNTSVENNFPDNTTGRITPGVLRNFLKDLFNSILIWADDVNGSDATLLSNAKVPTQEMVKAYVAAAASPGIPVGVIVDCLGWDASGNNYPTGGGTGTSGAIKRGNLFTVTVASPPDGNGDIKFQIGDELRALSDAPGQVDASWRHNRG